MKQFRLVDNLMGWLAFAIAAFTYCMTVEPTASFWDCPEFITTAYKLEVGHPPGAPFFMLTGNLFSQFVSDPTKVALMINIMNALLSAACIMFLFWTISHLTRKLICKDGWVENSKQLIIIEAASMVGALAYCWSDTFWFSAVEGEVYAFSSLFTALVVWLMLKWEDNADKPHSDRWLILIAYLTGLSIGVHLLNLLCLPALVLIYYFRRTSQPTLKGSITALLVSFALLAAVLYGIVPGIVKVGGWFELLFVNVFTLPFNTGLIFYIVALFGVVIWAIWETVTVRSRLRMNISYMLSVAMLGIPFYGYGITSFLIGFAVLAGLYGILIYRKNGHFIVGARLMNTSLLCMFMIMIGYSSYALIVIRSMANTPMDQNSPEDIFTLGTYLNREQYGSRPLFYGETFNSQYKVKVDENDLKPTWKDGKLTFEKVQGKYLTPVFKKGDPIYRRVEKKSPDEPDRYELRHKSEVDYDQSSQLMFFPRMYSSMPRHKEAYDQWLGGFEGKKVEYKRTYTVKDPNTGEEKEVPDDQTVMIPTQGENLRFFFGYQVNYMYWRYFMWNFAGRQNDIQGQRGELEKGNWITGISFIDNARLGDQSKLPTELRENKGRNVFFCLPLLLGIMGLLWQVYRPKKEKQVDGITQFWVVFFLFFMTGLAIVVYLNQTPDQPRERDYAYAGSFYAFAIWIGLGAAALAEWLQRLTKQDVVGVVAACLCLLVPIQMVSQTWDDHDRSGRYTCRDYGQNYLATLQEEGNPIIFTNGDNDTFPLWYAQETEGFRTDARVCNLSYLNTDWYIDQMKRPAYDSPATPITWERIYYAGDEDYEDQNEYSLRVQEGLLEETIELLKKHDPSLVAKELGDDPYELKNIIDHWILNPNRDRRCFPTNTVHITIDKKAAERSGMKIPEGGLPDKMVLNLPNIIGKNEMMLLEMLANANWERPLYVAITVDEGSYRVVKDYLMQEGLAFRIVPYKTGGAIDTDRMYDNLMGDKFKWGGIDKEGLYLDETVLRMCYSHRNLFVWLAQTMLAEADELNEKEEPWSYSEDEVEDEEIMEEREDKDEVTPEVLKKVAAVRQVLLKAEEAVPETNVHHVYRSGSSELAYAWMQCAEYATKAGDMAQAEKDYEHARYLADKVALDIAEYYEWYVSLGDRFPRYAVDDGTRMVSGLYRCVYILQESGAQRTFANELAKMSKMLIEKMSGYVVKDLSSKDFHSKLGGDYEYINRMMRLLQNYATVVRQDDALKPVIDKLLVACDKMANRCVADLEGARGMSREKLEQEWNKIQESEDYLYRIIDVYRQLYQEDRVQKYAEKLNSIFGSN